MKISDNGLDIIKSFEGYGTKLPGGGCKAYRTYLGNGKYDVWTIGWGCTEGITADTVWTREQAEEALKREVARFEEAVRRNVKFIPTQNQFDALVSFAYNVGETGLAKSSVLAYANQGELEKAANSFGLWVKAQGNTLPGLVRRRAEEAALFMKSDSPSVEDIRDTKPDEPSMPQTVDVPIQPSTRLLKSHTMYAGGTTAAIGAATVLSSIMNGIPTVEQAVGVQTLVQQVMGIFPPAAPYLGAVSALLGGYVMFRRVYVNK